MRYPLFSLLLFVASATPAAQAWRWVDQNGVVHYSDQPRPGAQMVQIQPAPKPGSVAPPITASDTDSETVRPTERVFRYTQCLIKSPEADSSFDSPESVGLLLQLSPALRPRDSVQATLDGEPLDWPPQAYTHALQAPERGTHMLRLRIVDARQQVVCEAAPVTFTVLRPSLLMPGRKPKPR